MMDGFSFVVMENVLGPFYEAHYSGPDNQAGWVAFKAQARPKMLETSKKLFIHKKPKLCPFAQLSGSFKLQ